MGWGSGGDIFEPVAWKMRDLKCTDEQITQVLSSLIRELQDLDWDTEEESLGLFDKYPAVVAAFAANGVFLYTDPRHPYYDEFMESSGKYEGAE